jgi:hypothetical protein
MELGHTPKRESILYNMIFNYAKLQVCKQSFMDQFLDLGKFGWIWLSDYHFWKFHIFLEIGR